MDTGTSELKTKIPPGMRLKDKRPCSGLRADLKTCVLASDCVKKDKRLPKDCLSEGLVHEECISMVNLFIECKRQLVDMRTRFRGRVGY